MTALVDTIPAPVVLSPLAARLERGMRGAARAPRVPFLCLGCGAPAVALTACPECGSLDGYGLPVSDVGPAPEFGAALEVAPPPREATQLNCYCGHMARGEVCDVCEAEPEPDTRCRYCDELQLHDVCETCAPAHPGAMIWNPAA